MFIGFGKDFLDFKKLVTNFGQNNLNFHPHTQIKLFKDVL
jgi:hypothetical protein